MFFHMTLSIQKRDGVESQEGNGRGLRSSMVKEPESSR